MQAKSVERWGLFEVELAGPARGNPFMDVQVAAEFQHGHRSVRLDGFYDGEGVYRVRFMPDAEGNWTYTTHSNRKELDGRTGEFVCTPASDGNHGPVQVANRYHFAYADGTHFSNFGTTCYAWAHQGQEMIDQTLRTLAGAPFNKMRMCTFPKSYLYSHNEPPVHAFPVLKRGATEWSGQSDSTQPITWQFDFSRFEPAFFQNLDRCVLALMQLGIEADVIVLHPYDRWGYATMPADVEDRYLRYLCARLSAFRNVWWSLCNEWDLLYQKKVADWERIARVIQENDPYGHLRSIHNGHYNYDHSRPWVTHVSLQGSPDNVAKLRQDFGKPVVVDECGYEGTIAHVWGSLSGPEMTWRFWMSTCLGGYCGHGETYLNQQEVLWWSKGGQLTGQSPACIAFLRSVVEQKSDLGGYEPFGKAQRTVCRGKEEILWFGSVYQPCRWEVHLPKDNEYTVEIIDPWEMTVTALPETFRGKCVIPLPGKPYMVARAVRRSGI